MSENTKTGNKPPSNTTERNRINCEHLATWRHVAATLPPATAASLLNTVEFIERYVYRCDTTSVAAEVRA